MALLAEELVEEWLRRQGYFTEQDGTLKRVSLKTKISDDRSVAVRPRHR